MPLSHEQKAKLVDETASAAKHLAEDLVHIREVLARRATSKAEIRRLSAVIRRILVDGDLMDVASPRVGKLLVTAPDCRRWYDVEKFARLMFFAAGGAPVFGAELEAIAFLNAGQLKGPLPPELVSHLTAPSATMRVTMRLDNFLAQRVLCLDGHWISRRTAIKHIAHYGSGVHSKVPDNYDDKACAVLRGCCSYSVVDGQVKVHVLPHLGKDSCELMCSVDPPWTEAFPVDVLDPVLLQVLAAGAYITESQGVQELERIIALEP